MENKGYIGVIIPAAGSGSRMGGVYKPLEKLCGKEMLLYSLDTFQNCDCVGFVVISAREDKIDEVKKLLEAIERGDVDKEEAGNIGKMLKEAKSLMAGNPTEEMKSWDRKKRFEEVMKTMRNDGQNRDDRDEKN